MLRSMYSGISGMKNFQTKLDVIGNNIANVNTYGFKKGRVTFKDTMNQTISGASASTANQGGKNPMQVGLGSTLGSIDIIDTQSSLQTTGRPLDLAIDGDGYFIVKQGNQNLYTRAGNFYLDNNGTLVNSDGYKVQQYVNGKLQDISVDVNSLLPAKTTANIDVNGNFPTGINSADQTQQIEVVDSSGNKHVVQLETTKGTTPAAATPGEDWTFTLEDKSLTTPIRTVIQVFNMDKSPTDPTKPRTYNVFQEKYDAATDTWSTVTGSTSSNLTGIKLDVADENGAPITSPFGNTNLNFNLKDITTSANSNLQEVIKPDGNIQGAIESFNIGSDGTINGVFSNGLNLSLGTIALAKFSNPSGLQKAGNNVFQASTNSGTANYGVPGNGNGSIASGSLEMSNVDLSEEFTEMIVAQRGFQANTRIITTSDEILQELINLKH